MSDCDHVPEGHLRDICEGTSGLSPRATNIYRTKRFGVPPLPEDQIKYVPKPTYKPRLEDQTNGYGPGSQLIQIYSQRGVPHCQACYDLAAQMDAWGIEGCRQRLTRIAEDMLPRARQWIADNKSWVDGVFAGIDALLLSRWKVGERVEDAIVLRFIKRDISKAIKAAEKAGVPEGPRSLFRKAKPRSNRPRAASHRPLHGREIESAAVAVEPVWRNDESLRRLAAELLSQSEIVVKSFIRHDALEKMIQSVRRRYPSVPIRVIDDSFRKNKTNPTAERIKAMPGVSWHQLPYDSGLPAGRNYGVRQSSAKYIILADDDSLFTDTTDLTALLIGLNQSRFDIVGGCIKRRGTQVTNWCGTFSFKGERPRRTLKMAPLATLVEVVHGIRLRQTDVTYNFFAVERQTLLENPWDERYKIGAEHLDSFLTWKEAGLQVAYTIDCISSEVATANANYRAMRSRKQYQKKLMKKWGIAARHTLGLTVFHVPSSHGR